MPFNKYAFQARFGYRTPEQKTMEEINKTNDADRMYADQMERAKDAATRGSVGYRNALTSIRHGYVSSLLNTADPRTRAIDKASMLREMRVHPSAAYQKYRDEQGGQDGGGGGGGGGGGKAGTQMHTLGGMGASNKDSVMRAWARQRLDRIRAHKGLGPVVYTRRSAHASQGPSLGYGQFLKKGMGGSGAMATTGFQRRAVYPKVSYGQEQQNDARRRQQIAALKI